MQLRITHFSTDDVHVILTDCSYKTKRVSEYLCEIGFFSNVHFLKIRVIDSSKFFTFYKLMNIRNIIFGSAPRIQNIKNLENCSFDELVYYNFGFLVSRLFAYFNEQNSNLICSGMEEGILSYDSKIHSGDWSFLKPHVKTVFALRKLLGKANLPERTQNFYCFYPEL